MWFYIYVYAIVTEVGLVDASLAIKAHHWNNIISVWLNTHSWCVLEFYFAVHLFSST